jgi:cell division septation protein DedD
VAGGGLAYAYKIIVGPSASGTPPVIKADTRPAKSQPEDPGGRQFAHSDSKLMGRLGSDSSSSSTSGSARASTLDSNETGVRRVPTIVVGRDGSIAPPTEPRLPPPTVSVPGMTIVNGFGLPPVQPPEREERVEAAQVPPAPQVPQIIARADPQPSPSAAESASRQSVDVPPLPVRSATVTPASTSSRQAAPQPKAAQPAPRQTASAPAQKSQPVGYVAVLASQKSRIDALKTFADLQQKYAHVLRNKIPDVQEADLSARGLGTMYRVVVGPPGSREAAADLCGQLKSAGFEGCWITTY